MQRNKGGLADLKKLRQQAEESAKPAAAPATAKSRKRAKFLPPGASDARPAAPKRPAAGHKISAPRSEPAPPAPDLLTEEDRKLFQSAVRYVERIKDPGRQLLAPVAPAPAAILKERRLRAAGVEPAAKTRKPDRRPRKDSLHGPAADSPSATTPAGKARTLSDGYTPATSDHDDTHYLKSGHGTDVLRDLKRGKWPIGASLDLHGSTLEDARDRFDRFLSSCLMHDVKCVRIVHGKGHGSPDGNAVLKTTVRRWLTQLPEVTAYIECSEENGGSGAVQVLLRTQ